MNPTAESLASAGARRPQPLTGTCRAAAPSHVPGTPVAVGLAAEQQAEVDRLAALAAETQRSHRRAAPCAGGPSPSGPRLGYDPQAALNFPLIQASALRLDGDRARPRLPKTASSSRTSAATPTSPTATRPSTSHDLPVFISADSILQAVHQSYDGILKSIELAAAGARALAACSPRCAASLASETGLEPTTRKDADLFLTLAVSLLKGSLEAPVAGAAGPGEIRRLFGLAQTGERQ